MDKNESLAQAKSLLHNYREAGLQQLKIYKELNPGPIKKTRINGDEMGELNGVYQPIEVVKRKVVVQEDTFLIGMLECIWNYFLLNTEDLESPSRQGIDRTLLELCYQKLIPFIKATNSEKTRIMLITSICDVGMILAAPSEQDRAAVPGYTDDYNFWVSQLSITSDKDKYEQLQKDGYPTHEFSKAKHNLWPSFYKSFTENSSSIIFPWADNNKNPTEKAKVSFLRLYNHLHDFVHGSHLSALTAIEARDSKDHIFATCAISMQVGYQVLYIINKKFLGDRAIELNELYQATGKIFPELARHYSHLQ